MDIRQLKSGRKYKYKDSKEVYIFEKLDPLWDVYVFKSKIGEISLKYYDIEYVKPYDFDISVVQVREGEGVMELVVGKKYELSPKSIEIESIEKADGWLDVFGDNGLIMQIPITEVVRIYFK